MPEAAAATWREPGSFAEGDGAVEEEVGDTSGAPDKKRGRVSSRKGAAADVAAAPAPASNKRQRAAQGANGAASTAGAASESSATASANRAAGGVLPLHARLSRHFVTQVCTRCLRSGTDDWLAPLRPLLVCGAAAACAASSPPPGYIIV